jgi:hypothetical protein
MKVFNVQFVINVIARNEAITLKIVLGQIVLKKNLLNLLNLREKQNLINR